MSSKFLAHQIGITSAFSLQVPSLGETELMQVEIALSDFAPDWLVELHHPCPDAATLVLFPASGEDAAGPSFLVSEEAFGFRIDQVHWDALTEVGIFASMNDVLLDLRQRLAFCAHGTTPTSMMVH